ncbi:hypothetical protein H696_02250 [Fonticula alba]|uniref:Uncharacterized protein n=1 Tax=Fonticula alba TaxID=691883 RepID=A0A058ZAD3_FONAL|nr:hypothetical protein H696_02250 [Fonticula alba]KCV71304.1 hypothetical protein H696_02250 [Fonticula alba]|eukprot:XP_009494427.1 hypothetical protein H696_02250 [Fonticula alba]
MSMHACMHICMYVWLCVTEGRWLIGGGSTGGERTRGWRAEGRQAHVLRLPPLRKGMIASVTLPACLPACRFFSLVAFLPLLLSSPGTRPSIRPLLRLLHLYIYNPSLPPVWGATCVWCRVLPSPPPLSPSLHLYLLILLHIRTRTQADKFACACVCGCLCILVVGGVVQCRRARPAGRPPPLPLPPHIRPNTINTLSSNGHTY